MEGVRLGRLGRVAAVLGLLAASRLDAQQPPRRQPRNAFARSDFAKLKWLEGTWHGSATGEPAFGQRCRMVNDSTIEITYFDSTMSRATSTGRIYLTAGQVFHSFGSGRWTASHIDEKGAFFVPQANAQNTFAWAVQTPDSWSSTSRTGLGGHERVTVYQMRRVKR
jgi:hypothetical protein